jgi:hypothetical protein
MKEFIKRFAPFFLTFALGMFLASLFMPISAPRYDKNNKNYKRSWKHREYKRTKCENYRLRKQLEELRQENLELKDLQNVPQFPHTPDFDR